jgi:hypothetical protein
MSATIGPGHPLHRNLETVLQKVPLELRERMNRQHVPDDTPTDPPSDKALVRLHKQVITDTDIIKNHVLLYRHCKKWL